MVPMLVKRSVTLASVYNSHIFVRTLSFCLKGFATITEKEDNASPHSKPASEYSSSLRHSPLFSDCNQPSNGYDIELVDQDAWRLSSGLAQAWRGTDWAASGASSLGEETIDEPVDIHSSHVEGDLDFEEIDNMRIRGNLFYKLERRSIEFEEYNLEFHRKKSSKGKDIRKEIPKDEKLPKVRQVTSIRSVDGTSGNSLGSKKLTRSVIPQVDGISGTSVGSKKQRTPTFNQLTAPYHFPFCLDIFISKASVRACIVHRVTSKVVAVAHSISKDMKFDLGSTKNSTTCAAVGAILAQRALADDIHDVIYTPRKGENIEGKLEIVLQSIIDNGINVKVKIKQRRPKSLSATFNPKTCFSSQLSSSHPIT
ncbi:hypothetical protein L6164_025667 [Bauhinia variegata]|uniref:Uncharacterized protein n=1 Tax=Bauhinia variegata TaxID=167791 RepID=A0ACB9M193_BAUVA|nr:hypothetical protein L6164_025667 [Bauhinia variegata]